ncbi:MAG: hypothetical protein QS748_10870 [Candidatus Endonucleobacter bathymodioli]|uniref:Uncharacterized protein n=1 Tax=Candidatus Endonucleibacter bathymodioli TaxID=539814 RepID=A0AA90NXA4_9GAMM|nr:hypothetical protein [Candidatus Endonucleobacter bathymodioli]
MRHIEKVEPEGTVDNNEIDQWSEEEGIYGDDQNSCCNDRQDNNDVGDGSLDGDIFKDCTSESFKGSSNVYN